MFKEISKRLAALCFALLTLAPVPGHAEALVDVSEVLQLRVLPGWREAGGRHVTGLEITLKPGWHTYWRSAGSLGISPSFDWRGSQNVQRVTPIWPTPTVFYEAGGQSYGYDRSFVLPLIIETWNAGEPVHLAGQIDLGVCADICVPARVILGTDLQATGALDAAIQAALEDRPVPTKASVRCRLIPQGDAFRLIGEIPIQPMGAREAVVFELPGSNAWITDAEVERDGGTLRAEADIIGATGGIARSNLRITVLADGKAAEISGCSG
jgi:DsbC/DsbD-like thiol-disulfide interchange protein